MKPKESKQTPRGGRWGAGGGAPRGWDRGTRAGWGAWASGWPGRGDSGPYESLAHGLSRTPHPHPHPPSNFQHFQVTCFIVKPETGRRAHGPGRGRAWGVGGNPRDPGSRWVSGTGVCTKQDAVACSCGDGLAHAGSRGSGQSVKRPTGQKPLSHTRGRAGGTCERTHSCR